MLTMGRLATTHAAGLRVSEGVSLKVSGLDTNHVTVRIEQANGAMDRYVPLSLRLLKEWRAFWQRTPLRHWLFPNRLGTRRSLSRSPRSCTRSRSCASGSASRGASTPYAMPSPRISSRRDVTFTPCSACWAPVRQLDGPVLPPEPGPGLGYPVPAGPAGAVHLRGTCAPAS